MSRIHNYLCFDVTAFFKLEVSTNLWETETAQTRHFREQAYHSP